MTSVFVVDSPLLCFLCLLENVIELLGFQILKHGRCRKLTVVIVHVILPETYTAHEQTSLSVDEGNNVNLSVLAQELACLIKGDLLILPGRYHSFFSNVFDASA